MTCLRWTTKCFPGLRSSPHLAHTLTLKVAVLLTLAMLTACGEREDTASQASAPAEPPPAAAIEPSAEPACELTMGWDPWEPYQYEIAGGQVFGLDVDLVTAVSNKAGCTLTFEKGNWGALLARVREGDIDLLAGATPTGEREAFARFTTPYRDEQFELFLRADRLDAAMDQDLTALLQEGWRIGLVEGYLYGDTISALQDNPAFADQFLYTAMAETNMARLLEGAVDALIEDKYVGAAIIRHKNLQNDIQPHPVRFASTEISIMASRASVDEALFKRLDDSVQTLIDNGDIEKLLSQYAEP